MLLRKTAAGILCIVLLITLCVPAAASELNWAQELVGLSTARDYEITGSGVVVGIIDSGLYDGFAAHTSATILEGTNYLVAENHPDRHTVTDTYGHGTAVASILADSKIGLAPDVTIVPLKAFDGKSGTYETLAEALRDAVDVYHCDVVNLSLGSIENNPVMEAAVQHAIDSGVILIAAVGNRMSSKPSNGNDPYYYPASQEGVISVGAVNSAKQVTTASTQNDRLCVTAPGYRVPILTTTGNYTTGGGTSYAAPYVAAAAALALSADPTLTAEGFTAMLQATAEDLGSPGFDNAYGYGLMDLDKLLPAIANRSPLLQTDEETGTISALVCLPEDRTYWMLLCFYNESGQYVTSEILRDLTGTRMVDNISFPEGCTTFRCIVTASNLTPLLCASQIKRTTP